MNSTSSKTSQERVKSKATHPASPVDTGKSVKRRRVYPTPKRVLAPPEPPIVSSSNDSREETKQADDKDILRWILSRDEVAPCFIKDVFDMRVSSTKGMRILSRRDILLSETLYSQYGILVARPLSV